MVNKLEKNWGTELAGCSKHSLKDKVLYLEENFGVSSLSDSLREKLSYLKIETGIELLSYSKKDLQGFGLDDEMYKELAEFIKKPFIFYSMRSDVGGFAGIPLMHVYDLVEQGNLFPVLDSVVYAIDCGVDVENLFLGYMKEKGFLLESQEQSGGYGEFVFGSYTISIDECSVSICIDSAEHDIGFYNGNLWRLDYSSVNMMFKAFDAVALYIDN